MPLTSKQLLSFANTPLTGMDLGRVKSAINRLDKEAKTGRATASVRPQIRFLQALVEAGPSEAPKSGDGGYKSPFSGPAKVVTRQKGGLSDAEYRWIDRLPRDPAQVTLQDIRVLRSMSTYFPRGDEFEDQRRFLEAVIRPIREHHESAGGVRDVAVAQKPMPSLPTSELAAALHATYTEEMPGVPADALISSADTAVTQAVTERQTAWDTAAAYLEAAVENSRLEAAERTRTVPE